MGERGFWLGFSLFSGIGPKRFKLLIEHFDTAERAWKAEKNELEAVLGSALTHKFLTFRSSFDLSAYQLRIQEKDVLFVTLRDDAYPPLLRKIENPPFVLYIKGDITCLGQSLSLSSHTSTTLHSAHDRDMIIGIVGTRRITSYGRQVTEMITAELVRAGFIIVSGLALGIDAVAHQSTIAGGGKTIAVLGCGVDCCNPTTNQRLYNSIVESGGAVVSEFPLTQAPSIGSFPSRNRIIAGLSQAIVVTEGAEDSGALITAKDALSVGRTVFAVPGQITSSLAKGPLKLLQQGAKLVTSGEDIIKELQVTPSKSDSSGLKLPHSPKPEIKGDTREEQRIIDLLQSESLKFDELVQRTGISTVQIGTVLSLMEMKGMITSLANGDYSLAA